MKTFCLVVGLIAGASGASIDVLEVDTATQSAVAGVIPEAFTWKYDSQTLASAHDPSDWGSYTAADTCGTGTSQSPIDVVTANVMTETGGDVGAIVGHLFDRELSGYLSNNGRGVRFSHLGMARPTISGGALGTKIYAFSHIDFHFGAIDTEGSEHMINGDQYAMEMQMVFYDGSFMSNMDAEQSTDPDALVSIAHLFKVGTSDNTNLDVIVNALTDIEYSGYTTGRRKREAEKARQSAVSDFIEMYDDPLNSGSPGSSNIVALTLNVSEILGGATQIDNYYYYDGSMTIPNCLENTKWIISQNMLEISTAQLNEFRTLKTDSTFTDSIHGNFRPTQALNSRTVYKRTAPFAIDETQLKILGGTLAGIPTFFLVNQFLNQPETAKALRENPVAEFVQTNLNNLFNQEVVQQRSSDEASYQQYQEQPVYQPVQYQQYVPQAAPAAQ